MFRAHLPVLCFRSAQMKHHAQQQCTTPCVPLSQAIEDESRRVDASCAASFTAHAGCCYSRPWREGRNHARDAAASRQRLAQGRDNYLDVGLLNPRDCPATLTASHDRVAEQRTPAQLMKRRGPPSNRPTVGGLAWSPLHPLLRSSQPIAAHFVLDLARPALACLSSPRP